MQSNHRMGFSLIEILVVIAIIGILASVVMVNLNSAKQKARIAAAQATMASLSTVLTMCVNAGDVDLTSPAVDEDVCGANDGDSTYPALPSGWLYGAGTSGLTEDLDITESEDYKIVINSVTDGAAVSCGQDGCATDNEI